MPTEMAATAKRDNFLTSQSSAEYFCGPDSDTDTENLTLPKGRRWAWYCKLPGCPKYYRPWALKTNFMLHLYETPAHQNDPATRTREGRRRLAESWQEETDYDMTEPVKKPPRGWPPTVGNNPDITEGLMRQAGGDPNLAAMLTTRTLEDIWVQEQASGEGNAPT
ncbi:hypothetical protein AJ79_10316 [Helicocarpus griseus UAMH5409]|uniref:Uncharacterized protein n=1 Tax=Helicocarpus griseus UAMH5409 TaxID=1447875 RepID=A0A2B7WEK4_9EURO|nr:hypothetical protein AJ79_10316 [Helicocarpus griseus UAMH5409]